MAENVLETRILLRYGTYSQWMNSDVILMKGEAAIAAFPDDRVIDGLSNITPENTPPAIGIKIGDGIHYFYELPWLQAVAADVYNWAKSSTKPSYEASEILGLANYIEQYSSSSSGISASAYRIYYNESTQKYILQYQDSATQEWMDTVGEIDFSKINQRVLQLENWAGGATSSSAIGSLDPLVISIRDEFFTQMSKINYNDSAQPNQFVTAVSQSNGKINVTREPLRASDIASGTISVSQGGTGAAELTENGVLIGNGTNPVTTKELATTIYSDSLNTIPTSGAVVKYVNEATAGLTGAMHFIGEATVVINNNSSVDPRISGYTFSQAQPGDVILYEYKEYVWSGSNWRLLGDEGSYVIKGSITNADISEDANISQSKIEGLVTDLSEKVDKIEGKGLSTKDYTAEEKEKLETIEQGAQANVVEHIFVNDLERVPTTVNGLAKSVNLQISVFDEDSHAKLDGITAGAQPNEIEHIFVNGVERPITTISEQPKSVNIEFVEYTSEEKNKLAAIETEAQVNKIESLVINGVTYQPDNNKQISVTIDQAALNLNVLEGAQVPGDIAGTKDEIEQISKKLQLARIAATGNVKDLKQTTDTYITLDCGSSTEVI